MTELKKEWFHPIHESLQWTMDETHGQNALDEMRRISNIVNEIIQGEKDVPIRLLHDEPWIFFSSICQVWDSDKAEYQPFLMKEPFSMAIKILHEKLTHSDCNEPVFVNAPRQSGSTVWLLAMAMYWSFMTTHFYNEKRHTYLVAINNVTIKMLEDMMEQLFPSEMSCFYENIQFLTPTSSTMNDLLNHGYIGGTDIHRSDVDLFLDSYEFFPEDVLKDLIRSPERSMIVTGVSTLKNFQSSRLKNGTTMPNPLKIFFDQVCMRMDICSTWVFREGFDSDLIHELLLSTPIQIRFAWHQMRSLKNQENEISTMVELSDELMSEIFMIRKEDLTTPQQFHVFI